MQKSIKRYRLYYYLLIFVYALKLFTDIPENQILSYPYKNNHIIQHINFASFSLISISISPSTHTPNSNRSPKFIIPPAI